MLVHLGEHVTVHCKPCMMYLNTSLAMGSQHFPWLLACLSVPSVTAEACFWLCVCADQVYQLVTWVHLAMVNVG